MSMLTAAAWPWSSSGKRERSAPPGRRWSVSRFTHCPQRQESLEAGSARCASTGHVAGLRRTHRNHVYGLRVGPRQRQPRPWSQPVTMCPSWRPGDGGTCWVGRAHYKRVLEGAQAIFPLDINADRSRASARDIGATVQGNSDYHAPGGTDPDASGCHAIRTLDMFSERFPVLCGTRAGTLRRGGVELAPA